MMMEKKFYLGGGTALALYFGHRHSVDLDWFTDGRMNDPFILAQAIRDEKITFVADQTERGTLHGKISGVRVSFLEYRYPLLKPLISLPECGCLMASPEDLACMKLSAITQRGSKKDFLDIYALSRKYISLNEVISLYQKKYSVQDIAHLLYGLAYFEEADHERMPKMYWKSDWKTVKKTLQAWLKELVESPIKLGCAD
jgi:predicted nucleotidyltransferase component of viral defense system